MGEWTHVAATYNSAAMKVYYNSKLIDAVAASGAISASTGPLYIRTKHPETPASDEQKSIIDKVRLYNRALTKTEVVMIYTDRTIDERIGSNPDKIFQEAYDQAGFSWFTQTQIPIG